MKSEKPLIGLTSYDTTDNCQKVLSVLQLATEAANLGEAAHEGMGIFLILHTVRDALKYETHREWKPVLKEASSK